MWYAHAFTLLFFRQEPIVAPSTHPWTKHFYSADVINRLPIDKLPKLATTWLGLSTSTASMWQKVRIS